MLEAMDNVNEFVQGTTFEGLVGNKMLCHAIVHNIQVVGEAAYKLTKEFCGNWDWNHEPLLYNEKSLHLFHCQ